MSARPFLPRSIRRPTSFSLFTLLALAIFRLGVGCSDSETPIATPKFDASTADVTNSAPDDASSSNARLPKTIATSNAAAWVSTGNTDPKWSMVTADATVTYGGASAGTIQTVESDAGAPDGGTAKTPTAASIARDGWSVAQYRGRRIRMTGYVKTDDVSSGATLWIRFDSDKTQLLLANGLAPKNRSIAGTHDFAPFVHVVDVPESATGKAIFGAILLGTGTMWVGGVTFEEVGTDVPVTPSVSQF